MKTHNKAGIEFIKFWQNNADSGDCLCQFNGMVFGFYKGQIINKRM